MAEMHCDSPESLALNTIRLDDKDGHCLLNEDGVCTRGSFSDSLGVGNIRVKMLKAGNY